MIRLAALLVTVAVPLNAEVYPAFHAVTGVAEDDVLNIRAMPSPSAEIIGTLAPDASGVEVMAVQDGWATLNAGDVTGYASASFLVRETGPDWNALETPLSCLGTEPFWSLQLDPVARLARFLTPEQTEPAEWPLGESWPGQPWSATAAVSLPSGLAVLSPAYCSDGMSDRSYGIAIDVFQSEGDGGRLSGCCLLALP